MSDFLDRLGVAFRQMAVGMGVVAPPANRNKFPEELVDRTPRVDSKPVYDSANIGGGGQRASGRLE